MLNKVIIIKFSKVAGIVNFMNLRKFKKTISCFETDISSFFYLLLSVSSVFIIFHFHF